ncbi:hypothetical protein C808_01236 [Lachnospiraceae bacterium M18-1]|nr:hypothetical protein C808_01236 [Lachnospiraceae bacterium M18-1]
MGMYHKNRFAGIRNKRYIKRCTSRGRRSFLNVEEFRLSKSKRHGNII